MDGFVVGTIVVLAVLVAAFVAGARVMGRRMEERFARLSPALCAEIGGIARRLAISGTYAGAPVRACIVGRDDGGVSKLSYFYEVTRDGHAGDVDWDVAYAGSSGWTVRSHDAELAAEMRRAGVLDALERWPSFPRVHYRARARRITYQEQVADRLAFPDAQAFRDQLELLARLAAVGAGRSVALSEASPSV